LLHLVASIRLVERDGWCQADVGSVRLPVSLLELRPPVPGRFSGNPYPAIFRHSIHYGATPRGAPARTPHAPPILLPAISTPIHFLLGKIAVETDRISSVQNKRRRHKNGIASILENYVQE
jgi:hypothetical protein